MFYLWTSSRDSLCSVWKIKPQYGVQQQNKKLQTYTITYNRLSINVKEEKGVVRGLQEILALNPQLIQRFKGKGWELRDVSSAWGKASLGRLPDHLIVIGVIQIFIIIISRLILLHLIPHRPFPRRGMAVIHRVVGIACGADIRAGGETCGSAWVNQRQLFSTLQPHCYTASQNCYLEPGNKNIALL